MGALLPIATRDFTFDPELLLYLGDPLLPFLPFGDLFPGWLVSVVLIAIVVATTAGLMWVDEESARDYEDEPGRRKPLREIIIQARSLPYGTTPGAFAAGGYLLLILLARGIPTTPGPLLPGLAIFAACILVASAIRVTRRRALERNHAADAAHRWADHLDESGRAGSLPEKFTKPLTGKQSS